MCVYSVQGIRPGLVMNESFYEWNEKNEKWIFREMLLFAAIRTILERVKQTNEKS